MLCIPSRTNSPACVLGDFPSASSSRARLIVSFSGVILSQNEKSLPAAFRRTKQSLRDAGSDLNPQDFIGMRQSL
jgi:hypothetical protein